jgi:hypothetical protein
MNSKCCGFTAQFISFVDMKNNFDTLIVGGGAAGFFTAVNLAEQNSGHSILILERGKKVLNKVRISGGGRCNVTHAKFEPRELAQSYPRGERELLGPFHQFMTGDTMAWFEERGVELKIEEDGRVFPTSDDSETIISCLVDQAKSKGVEIRTQENVLDFHKKTNGWELETKTNTYFCDNLIIATGSSPKIWRHLEKLNHSVVSAVPSLFTFNCKDERISTLAGIATHAEVCIPSKNLTYDGPLLVTHWGFSGPGILKLSAWGARKLNAIDYQFELKINWIPDYSTEKLIEILQGFKASKGKKQPSATPLFELPKRLWQKLVASAGIETSEKWGDLSKAKIQNLAKALCESNFQIDGKSTFKEEFVTAGGIELKEVNFKTFESKLHPNLYFAGEVLNIDAITGGFNFQNAWSGGYLIAKALSKKLEKGS